MHADVRTMLDEEFAAADSYKPNSADWLDGKWSGIGFAEEGARRGQTGVALDRLREIGKLITTVPEHFNAHKTIKRFLKNRLKMIEDGSGLDWAMGEALAFGSLLREGFPVRLSGQD